MNLPITATTIPTNSLPAQLQQIGLRSLPANLDDFLARAVKAKWSPRQILEQLVQSEAAERSHRSLERRLRLSGIKKFKPMADFDWTWPTKIERDVIERALTLDFLQEGRNLVLVGTNGLGKTMIAKNIGHAAVMAGSSVLFRSAPALLEELHRQTPEGRHRKLRWYASVGLLCLDEVGYLSFDDKAADYSMKSSTGVTNTRVSLSQPIDRSKSGMRSSPTPRALRRCSIDFCIMPM
jgi:DNA replication protein DnaC